MPGGDAAVIGRTDYASRLGERSCRRSACAGPGTYLKCLFDYLMLQYSYRLVVAAPWAAPTGASSSRGSTPSPPALSASLQDGGKSLTWLARRPGSGGRAARGRMGAGLLLSGSALIAVMSSERHRDRARVGQICRDLRRRERTRGMRGIKPDDRLRQVAGADARPGS